MQIRINMWFPVQRTSFSKRVESATSIGYRVVEPMVHNGRELLSEAGYFHSFSGGDRYGREPHAAIPILG